MHSLCCNNPLQQRLDRKRQGSVFSAALQILRRQHTHCYHPLFLNIIMISSKFNHILEVPHFLHMVGKGVRVDTLILVCELFQVIQRHTQAGK